MNAKPDEVGESRLLLPSPEFTQFAVDHAGDEIHWLDDQARFVYANDALCQSLGYSHQELLTMSIPEVDPDFALDTYAALIANARQAKFLTFETRHRAKDGRIFPVEVTVNYVEFDGKEYLCAFSRDITRRRQSEQALRESEEKYRRIVDTANEGIWILDSEFRTTFANVRLSQMLGYSPVELLGRNFDTFLFEEDLDDHAAKKEARRQGKAEQYERRLRRKDGQPLWVSISATPVLDPHGGFCGSFAMFTDITERKRIEAALQDDARQLALLYQIGHALTATLDLKQVLDRVLKTITEVVGAHAGSIWLVDEFGSGDLVLWASHYPEPARPMPYVRLHRGQGVTGWVAETGQSALIQRVADDPRFFGGIDRQLEFKTESMLAAPLKLNQNVIGVLHIMNKAAGPFSERDRELVETLAAPAAIAIENARLYESVQNELAERKVIEQALRDAKEASESANQAKSQFLARMSHEIRTPLHGISGLVTLLSGTELSADQAKYVEMIKSSAENLADIVNDILDFSKIEARRLELEQADLNLCELVEGTTETFALRAHGKGLELVSFVSPQVPDLYIGDALRLRQILANLIANALKFTDHGEIVVRVEAAVDQDPLPPDAFGLHFTVRDTGMGIPADKQAVIFQPFRQSDGSTTRQFGGTGLGLSICQQLVDLMGGRIWVESRPGEGSVFHFAIALRRPAADEPAAVRGPVVEAQGTSALVVDDNAASRRALTEYLHAWGFQVVESATGLSGLEEIERARDANHPFRVILLDRDLPRQDGFAIAGWFRDDPSVRETIVMLLRSNRGASDVTQCRDAGVTHHLLKPVKRHELAGAVTAVITPAAQPEAKPAPLAMVPPAGIDHAPELDPRSMSILFVEDNAVNRLVGEKMLRALGHRVAFANNGLEGAEKAEAERYDLIMMDIEMPVMDGLEATRQIRRKETVFGRRTAIVGMSAYASNVNRDECLAAGMDAYLSKPFSPAKLTQMLDTISLRFSLPSAPALFDLRVGLDTLGGNRSFLLEAVEVFIQEDWPRHMTDLGAGLSEKQAAKVKAAAHGLKGALSSFGGLAAAATVRRMEELAGAGEFELVASLIEPLTTQVRQFVELCKQATDEVVR